MLNTVGENTAEAADLSYLTNVYNHHHHNRLMALFRDHQVEPVPEENFWTLWCKGRLTEEDTPTIRLGATPSRLTSAHLHHPPIFTGRMPFLSLNQQCQSSEGNLPNLYKLQVLSSIVIAQTLLFTPHDL